MAQTLEVCSTLISSCPRQTRIDLKKEWFPSLTFKAATARFNVDRNVGSKRMRGSNSTPKTGPIVCSSVDQQGDASNSTGATTEVIPTPLMPLHRHVRRSNFPPPPRFLFGAASSAYQTEGAWNEDGKGESTWDWFSQNYPEYIEDHTNGNIATDFYHRYVEDIELMRDLGVETYRFSIAWSRILPDGTLNGGVNPHGLAFYNDLINRLKAAGITPFVTLFHWDVPLALEKKYGGFKSRKIVDDFKEFAKVCFDNFGDRVKYWITLNEPWTFATGYAFQKIEFDDGTPTLGVEGDPARMLYTVTHNLILAHAAAATLYKKGYQGLRKGEVGITLNSIWAKADTKSLSNRLAAERSNDFNLGWYMEPLVYGDYPFVMRALVKDRLPTFTDEEKEMVKGSFDFIGLNYYTSTYANEAPIIMDIEHKPNYSYMDDMAVSWTAMGHSGPIGKLLKKGSWIYLVPEGLGELLKFMKEKYENPNIYITENGMNEVDSLKGGGLVKMIHEIDDTWRMEYIQLHLDQLFKSIKEDKVNVKGYMVWSLTDNYEWNKGYRERFGLVHIDYMNDLKRTPKRSFAWYNRFLKS